jgi:hypothetical protein
MGKLFRTIYRKIYWRLWDVRIWFHIENEMIAKYRMYPEVIKKLKLVKGKDYILVFPKVSGFKAYDAQNILTLLNGQGYKVVCTLMPESAKGLKLKESPKTT